LITPSWTNRLCLARPQASQSCEGLSRDRDGRARRSAASAFPFHREGAPKPKANRIRGLSVVQPVPFRNSGVGPKFRQFKKRLEAAGVPPVHNLWKPTSALQKSERHTEPAHARKSRTPAEVVPADRHQAERRKNERGGQLRRPRAALVIGGRIGARAPFPPVRWVNIDGCVCTSLDPSAKNASAREHKRVGAVEIDHGQFQVAVEWCAFDAVPIHGGIIKRLSGSGFDCNQTSAFLRPRCHPRHNQLGKSAPGHLLR
jgi:hypothetical protein